MEKIDVENATISIDAVGCQKNIAEQILRLLVQKKDGVSKPKKRFKAALNAIYLEEILNVKF